MNGKLREKLSGLTETLVANVEVPEIYPQVVCGNECFAIGIDRNGVDMVCVCVGIYFSGDGSYNVVLREEARESEVGV